MLLSQEHFEKLRNTAWVIHETNKVYYIKYEFLPNDEYLFLVTDLCLVWFEHGHHEQIQVTVKEQLGMECKDQAASMLMYKKIKSFLPDGIHKCRVKQEPRHIKFFLPLEKGDIAALTWVFNCELLDQDDTGLDNALTGPKVIYHYFIVPSQTIVNYFTEKVLDDLPGKLRVPKGRTLFSSHSLNYFTSLQQQSKESNGMAVTQEPVELTTTAVAEKDLSSSQQQDELDREKEIKRKRDLAAYYAHRPQTQKKRRI